MVQNCFSHFFLPHVPEHMPSQSRNHHSHQLQQATWHIQKVCIMHSSSGEAEEEQVSRLRPDFSEAVGRIWAKGLLDSDVMPVRLYKAYILACICRMESWCRCPDVIFPQIPLFWWAINHWKGSPGHTSGKWWRGLAWPYDKDGLSLTPIPKNMEAAIQTMPSHFTGA